MTAETTLGKLRAMCEASRSGPILQQSETQKKIFAALPALIELVEANDHEKACFAAYRRAQCQHDIPLANRALEDLEHARTRLKSARAKLEGVCPE